MNEFKYLGIVNWAKDVIRDKPLSAGDKFFSETELCAIHNVSRQTVRQALACMERQGILSRRQGSGTFVQSPNAVAVEKDSHLVGIVSTYFSDYIFPSIVTGIERVLSDNNVSMQLMTTSNQVTEEARAIEKMLSQNVGGLIIEPSQSALPNPNMALYNEIRARDIPIVFFNAKYAWSGSPLVAMDDHAAGQIVTDHLISLGHKDIAGIFVFDNMQGHKRYQGYMHGLMKHKIPISDKRVMWYSATEKATLFENSASSIKAILEESTAVVCYNDSLAVELMAFCKQQGISVPGDISIVGIDDSNLARVCEVPLTSVSHPKQQLGETAATLLLEEMKNPNFKAKDVLFVPELVERDSSAALPGRVDAHHRRMH
ncbi:MAG TPA: substrate-binding domain-containing protein [Clostridiaceae bacterium]|nr:substrate-binding domain-containing protein [Clostridiaceae bacterium]